MSLEIPNVDTVNIHNLRRTKEGHRIQPLAGLSFLIIQPHLYRK